MRSSFAYKALAPPAPAGAISQPEENMTIRRDAGTVTWPAIIYAVVFLHRLMRLFDCPKLKDISDYDIDQLPRAQCYNFSSPSSLFVFRNYLIARVDWSISRRALISAKLLLSAVDIQRRLPASASASVRGAWS